MQLGDPQITLPSRTFRQKNHILVRDKIFFVVTRVASLPTKREPTVFHFPFRSFSSWP